MFGKEPSIRPSIFVSYAHDDEIEKVKLVRALMDRSFRKSVHVWDDRQLNSGRSWQFRIFTEMAESTLMIVLLTENYLSSDFCMNREVPAMLNYNIHEGVPILVIYLTRCSQSCVPLDGMPVWPPGDAPFAELPNPGRAIAELRGEIRRLMARKVYEKEIEFERRF